jgi:hypothetical protein
MFTPNFSRMKYSTQNEILSFDHEVIFRPHRDRKQHRWIDIGTRRVAVQILSLPQGKDYNSAWNHECTCG